jgi:hypothetical protein
MPQGIGGFFIWRIMVTRQSESDTEPEQLLQDNEVGNETAAPSEESGTQVPETSDVSGSPEAPTQEPYTQTNPLAPAQESFSANQVEIDRQRAEFEQRTQQINQEFARLQQVEVDREITDQTRQYQDTLVEQGYGSDQVQQQVASFKELQQGKQTLLHHAKQMQETMKQERQGMERAIALATGFSEQYKDSGITFQQLMKATSPETMELMAVKASLAKFQQSHGSQVPANAPQSQFDSGKASTNGIAGRERRLDVLTNKRGDWTEAEFEEVKKLREQV